MLLSDIFDSLAYGELSSMSFGSGIEVEDMPRMVNLINKGLADLHKRFMLKRGSLPIEVEQGKVRYALTAQDEPIIAILDVLAYDAECTAPSTYPIVQVNHPKYLAPDIPLCYMATAPTVLRFNHELDPKITYSVDYKAGHTPIRLTDYETVDPSKVEIDLPMTYLEALSLFVASKVIVPVENNLGNPQEGTNYRVLYEQACQALDTQGLDIDSTPQDALRFTRNGFV